MCHALPFCHLRIQAKLEPYPRRWKCTQTPPVQPKTIGDHLRVHRHTLHLLQQEVAKRLGVHVESVKNWERGATCPTLRQLPKIIQFLGYDPEPAPKTTLEWIRDARRRLGLTQKDLAKTLGTDSVTVYRWEKGLSAAPAKAFEILGKLLREKRITTPR